MTILIIGIAIGVLLYAWHRERILVTEERIREDMETILKHERRQALAERVRLYEEICQLQHELAASEAKAERAFTDGRTAADREYQESDRFIRAYEAQRLHMALSVRR